MKYLVICHLSLIVLLALPVWAGAGRSGGELLRLGGGPRPWALGEAYAGLANDTSAIFYNPAGLTQLDFPEVLMTQNNWLALTQGQLAACSLPVGFGVVGLAYSSFGSGDIQGYNITGEATSIFTATASNLNLSFAKKVNPSLSWGVGLKSLTEKLANNTASTLAFDVGLLYRYNRNITIGGSVLNFGSPLRFISEDTPLPTSYRVGVSFQTEFFGEEVSVVSDLVNYQDGTTINTGFEYLLKDAIILRGGYSGNILRAGLGITANLLAVDYSYTINEELGTTSQVSMSILFGATEQAKIKYFESMALGKAYLQEGRFGDAIIRFERSLNLMPKSEDASLYLRKAEAELENENLRKVFSERIEAKQRSLEEMMDSGKKFLDEGKYVEALGEFSKVLKIDPSQREALQLQSKAQLKMETELIKQSRQESRRYLGEAMKYVVLGQYQEALRQVEAALLRDPTNLEAAALKKKLGFILQLEGEKGKK